MALEPVRLIFKSKFKLQNISALWRKKTSICCDRYVEEPETSQLTPAKSANMSHQSTPGRWSASITWSSTYSSQNETGRSRATRDENRSIGPNSTKILSVTITESSNKDLLPEVKLFTIKDSCLSYWHYSTADLGGSSWEYKKNKKLYNNIILFIYCNIFILYNWYECSPISWIQRLCTLDSSWIK